MAPVATDKLIRYAARSYAEVPTRFRRLPLPVDIDGLRQHGGSTRAAIGDRHIGVAALLEVALLTVQVHSKPWRANPSDG